MATVVRTRVLVDGRVQGVFFRAETAETANRLGVYGWVRNLPDGRVEAVFEGDAERVGRAVDWARMGPQRAVVTSVEEFAEQPEGLDGFRIR